MSLEKQGVYTVEVFKRSNCPITCNEKLFNLHVSYSEVMKQYPTNPYNYIRIQIYNKDMITTRIEQVPATTFVEVVGTVGGLLGLWLGASMLSILEFCELLANLSALSCSSVKARFGKYKIDRTI